MGKNGINFIYFEVGPKISMIIVKFDTYFILPTTTKINVFFKV